MGRRFISRLLNRISRGTSRLSFPISSHAISGAPAEGRGSPNLDCCVNKLTRFIKYAGSAGGLGCFPSISDHLKVRIFSAAMGRRTDLHLFKLQRRSTKVAPSAATCHARCGSGVPFTPTPAQRFKETRYRWLVEIQHRGMADVRLLATACAQVLAAFINPVFRLCYHPVFGSSSRNLHAVIERHIFWTSLTFDAQYYTVGFCGALLPPQNNKGIRHHRFVLLHGVVIPPSTATTPVQSFQAALNLDLSSRTTTWPFRRHEHFHSPNLFAAKINTIR